MRCEACLATSCLSLCACLLLLTGPATAQTDAPVARSVSATEQSVRDGERLRILREELATSEQLAATLAHRKVERLAASDPVAADEAQAQHDRVLKDIEALQREISSTRSSAARGGGTGSAVAVTATAPSANKLIKATETARAVPASPWWDVYGKAARTLSATPLSPARPSGTARAPTPFTSRTE